MDVGQNSSLDEQSLRFMGDNDSMNSFGGSSVGNKSSRKSRRLSSKGSDTKSLYPRSKKIKKQ
jgi:hypothetical protein